MWVKSGQKMIKRGPANPVVKRFRDFSPDVLIGLDPEARAALLEAADLFMLGLRYDIQAIKLGNPTAAAKRRFKQAFK